MIRTFLSVLIMMSFLFPCTAVGKKEKLQEKSIEQNSAYYFNLAKQALQTDDLEKGLDHLNKVIQIQPDFPNAYKLRGLIYQRLGRYKRSNADLEKAIAINKFDSHSYGDIGWNHILQEDFTNALTPSLKAHELEPGNFSWPLNIGHIYLLTGDAQRSDEYYLKTLTLITTESEFNDIKSDFELFIQKEWQPELCRLKLQWFTKEFNIIRAPLRKAIQARAEMVKKARAGQMAEAIGYAEKEIEIYQKMYGPSNIKIAFALDNLAQLNKFAGNIQKAITMNKRSLEIKKSLIGKQHAKLSQNLNELGALYLNTGLYTDAIEIYRWNLIIFKDVYGEDHPQTANIYNDMGATFIRLGQYEKALELTNRAIQIRAQQEGSDSLSYAVSLHNRARILFAKSDYVAAKMDYEQAIQIYESKAGENSPVAITMRNNLAGTLIRLGKYEAAEAVLSSNLKIAKAVYGSQHVDISTCYDSFAQVKLKSGDFTAAKTYQVEALRIANKVLHPRHPLLATALNNAAVTYSTIGDYETAEQLYRQSIRIKEESLGTEHPDLVSTLLGLGEQARMLGDYKSSQSYLERAVHLSEIKLGETHNFTAIAINGLAVLMLEKGEYEEARILLQKSLSITVNRFGHTHPHNALLYMNLGICYVHQKNMAKAEFYYNRASDIAAETLPPVNMVTAKLLTQKAYLAVQKGDYDKAEELLDSSCQMNMKLYGPKHFHVADNLHNSAQVYVSWNRPQSALSHFKTSHGLFNEIIDDLSLWTSEKKLQAYTRYLEWRYDIFFSFIAHPKPWTQKDINDIFDLILAYKGRFVEALATRNRLALISDDPKLTETLNDLKTITENISRLSLSTGAGMNPQRRASHIQKLEKEQELLEEALAKNSAEYLRRRSKQKITTENLLKSLAPETSYLDIIQYRKYNFRKSKWEGDRHYLVLFLHKPISGRPIARILDLGHSEKMDQLITSFLRNLKRETESVRGLKENPAASDYVTQIKSLDAIRKTGSEIYTKVLLPFENEISASKYLCIAPMGNFHLIPFEVLSPTKSDEYLYSNITVYYGLGKDLYTSASEIDTMPIRNLTEDLIVLAAPDYGSHRDKGSSPVTSAGPRPYSLPRGTVRGWPIHFEELLGTLNEAMSIKRICTERDITLLTGANADEMKLKKLKCPRLLHLATHGFFLTDVKNKKLHDDSRGVAGIVSIQKGSPVVSQLKPKLFKLHNPLLRSGLALAGANRLADNIPIPDGEDDGILTAAEVTGLDFFGTELVVLSACDTGLGEVQRGEGVAGLRRAFKIAGAKNIIMSLWSVPDLETVWLMEEFYKRYFKGDKPVVALNKARNALRKRLIKRDGIDHPYYWAAFILEGSAY